MLTCAFTGARKDHGHGERFMQAQQRPDAYRSKSFEPPRRASKWRDTCFMPMPPAEGSLPAYQPLLDAVATIATGASGKDAAEVKRTSRSFEAIALKHTAENPPAIGRENTNDNLAIMDWDTEWNTDVGEEENAISHRAGYGAQCAATSGRHATVADDFSRCRGRENTGTFPRGRENTDTFPRGRENTDTFPRYGSAEIFVASERKVINDLIALTEDLKDQVYKLQGECSEQKEKLSSLSLRVNHGDALHLAQLASVQKQVAEMELAGKVRDAVAKVQEEVAVAVPSLPDSPGKQSRLGRALRSIHRAVSRSRSPSRSISPKKNIHVEFEDGSDARPFFGHSPSRGISREFSPERSRSPGRRIEERLAPKILNNITDIVDGQLQNLEIRMKTMETSFENWRQAAIPDGAVDGMCSGDLQMLSGLNVVRSRTDNLQMLLDPHTESAWDHPSCSVAHAGADVPSHPQCYTKKKSSRARRSWLSQVLTFRRTKGKLSSS